MFRKGGSEGAVPQARLQGRGKRRLGAAARVKAMFTHGDLARAPYTGLTDLQLRNGELEAEVERLRQALRGAEATARRSAVGAHDIRNALTVILAETDLLGSSLRDPDQQESIQALTSATRIVAAIAQEILV